jgi:hypothetical protein
VRWCGRCLEPVREFEPRSAVHVGGVVGTPRPVPRRSRWRGGPTSLGPVGKVLATVAVVLLGPWSLSFGTLLWAPVWVMVSVLVLREVWRPQPIGADEGPTAVEGFRERHPVLGRRIHPRLLLAAAVALLLVVPSVLDAGPAFAVEALGASVAVGALLAWLAGY